MSLEIITHPTLAPLRHGFFTRQGGASSGLFRGLNCGRGSSDQQGIVAVLPRADKADVLLGARSIAALPPGAVVGTSAPRRAAQLLATRPDLEVFLPPIGGQTVYIFGAPEDLADPTVELTARVHDECNGSDVFGSDICTCRPYLTHAIEECIRGAQRGGVGLVAYSRKEGRALGEVTKFLVYNARKRQLGGDTAEQYFARTECVAGVQDMRFQELMPDVLHWLGIRKIHHLVSMSNMKYDAITGSGIEVGERVNIPEELIPPDARVEIDAKMAAGYFTPGVVPDADELKKVKGRGLDG